MEQGTVIFTAVVAAIGQWAKSHPKIPNWIPQAAMLVLGLVWYAGNHGFPTAPVPTFQGYFMAWAPWLETALLSAVAVNGTASLISLHPAMKTRVQPNP